MLGRKLLVAFVLALGLSVSAVHADSYFYGVGNDEAWYGSHEIWMELEDLPEWHINRCASWANRRGWDTSASIYTDIQGYASSLEAGDVFLFSYMGHGGWDWPDANSDEGSTSRPDSNDPTPPNPPPYTGDESIGRSGDSSTYWMRDDQLADAFADFDSGVEVVVISGACHSGGLVGGSSDIDYSVPAGNDGLYAMLGAPEHGTSVGYYAGYSETFGDYYRPLLSEALLATLEPNISFPEWYDAAMTHGETQTHETNVPWQEENLFLEFWPESEWVPTTQEETWYTDHWGWQESYAQLRPIEYNSLDSSHDHLVGTPEPTSTSLVILVLLGVSAKLRRRKQS